jgi:hypothetical protein
MPIPAKALIVIAKGFFEKLSVPAEHACLNFSYSEPKTRTARMTV